jgi:hypothetical protein
VRDRTDIAEALAQGGWLFMVVVSFDAALYWHAVFIATVGGYLLFRIHWSRCLAHTYQGLAFALAVSEEQNRGHTDDFFEDLAVLSLAAHEAAGRRHWVARWPFAGLLFRLDPISACTCGGTRLFVEREVKRPPFPAVCMRCGQGARTAVEEAIARAGRRWAERQGIEV